MNLAALVIMGISSVLLYGAVRNVNPLELVKNTMSGGTAPIAGSWGDSAGQDYSYTASPVVTDLVGDFVSGKTSSEYPKGTGKWPTISRTITATYGQKGAWSKGYHTGVDIAGKEGDPIYSVTSGTVVFAGYDSSFGNNVIVKTLDGYYVQYAHMKSAHVVKGLRVKPGTNVGAMGHTGNVRSSSGGLGTHLHFEVRSSQGFGSDINPMPLLKGGS